jgi:hypothetical protein
VGACRARLGRPGLALLKNRHGVLDTAEVQRVPGQFAAVGGGLGFEDGDGFLDAAGVG